MERDRPSVEPEPVQQSDIVFSPYGNPMPRGDGLTILPEQVRNRGRRAGLFVSVMRGDDCLIDSFYSARQVRLIGGGKFDLGAKKIMDAQVSADRVALLQFTNFQLTHLLTTGTWWPRPAGSSTA